MTEAIATTSPDWNVVQCDILCPLCDYNLRGLEQPRCPECGHQFVWSEVLSQGDRTHPFLFEHQPHRSIWAFFMTLRASMMPWKFWRSVLPIHPVIVQRLIIYWILLIAPGFFAALPNIPRAMRDERAKIIAWRQSVTPWLKANPADPQAAVYLKKYGSPVAAANAMYPLPGTTGLLWHAVTRNRTMLQLIAPTLAAAVLWPWVTLASLLIFRASLAQARIKTGHVLRCVIYCEDQILVLLSALILASLSSFVQGAWIVIMDLWVAFSMSLAALLLTFRLTVAYRLYLRFPHAIATVIASQIIVGLALFKAYLMWLGF